MRDEHSVRKLRRDDREPDPRFGQIGISAVAAALRYAGERRNPVKAPSRPAEDRPQDERAA